MKMSIILLALFIGSYSFARVNSYAELDEKISIVKRSCKEIARNFRKVPTDKPTKADWEAERGYDLESTPQYKKCMNIVAKHLWANLTGKQTDPKDEDWIKLNENSWNKINGEVGKTITCKTRLPEYEGSKIKVTKLTYDNNECTSIYFSDRVTEILPKALEEVDAALRNKTQPLPPQEDASKS